jgi:hypothetical protein
MLALPVNLVTDTEHTENCLSSIRVDVKVLSRPELSLTLWRVEGIMSFNNNISRSWVDDLSDDEILDVLDVRASSVSDGPSDILRRADVRKLVRLWLSKPGELLSAQAEERIR